MILNKTLASPLLLSTLLAAPLAMAQQYPNKPIHMIVGYGAGATDTAARTVARPLSTLLKVQVVVENKPGAGGALGAEYVQRAAPDGYTLFYTVDNTLTLNPHLYKSLNYQPLNYSPISKAVTTVNVLAVAANNPAKTLKELLAQLKANPAKATYGSAGRGTSNHLAGELLQHVTSLPLIHVPYKGSTQALQDMLGGRIAFMFSGVGHVLPFVKSGKLRILGTADTVRHAALPDVPTMEQAGLKGFDLPSIDHSVVGPPKMQPAVVTKLNQSLRAALADREIEAQINKQGYDTKSTTPEELGAQLRKAYDIWGKIVTAAKIQKQ